MSQQQQGRARGRARGRGRGATNEPPPRRPGTQAPNQGPPGMQAGQPMAAQGGIRPPMAAQGGPPMGVQYAVGQPMGGQGDQSMGAQYAVGQPMGGQGGPPMGAQYAVGQPIRAQGGPPMGAQYSVGQPMAAQGGPPMGVQGGPPMGAQGGPPMGAQYAVGPPMGAESGVGQPMAAPVATGRARQRGGATARAPGAPPTSQLEALTLGDRPGSAPGGGGARRRRGGVVVEEPHTRPGSMVNKKGTTGNKINMITNFFKVKPKPQWVLFQYHVEFSPEVDHRKARIAMVYGQEALLGDTKIFDGMILFLPKRLENDQTVVYTKRKTDDADIRITITLTNEVPPTSPICLQIYNILFRKFLKNIGMQEINRNYYNPALKVAVEQHKLEVWPGFVTSILQYESKTLLLADVSHKIMRTDTVLDLMYDLFARDQRNFYEKATKMLVGEIVLTRYNNQTYRIDDISWDEHPADRFRMSDGKDISFMEYYERQYNRKIEDKDQPLLLSRAKKKTKEGEVQILKLIPELCTLTGLTEEARQNFHVMKDIAVHTRITPDRRSVTLQRFINQLNSNAEVQKEMRGWQIEFDQNLLQLEGRTVPKEKLFCRDGQDLDFKRESADWSRELRSRALLSTKPLKEWLLIFPKRISQNASDFLGALHRVGPAMDMQIHNPIMCDIPDERTESYLRAMKQLIKPNVTQMVVCITKGERKDCYDAIKKFCCVEHPVPSQVIRSRTLQKKQMLMSVATKIGMQLNCKMGGELWAVEIPLTSLMVVGIDVYHDSLTKGQSVGGFVASMNRHLTRWYSQCTFHKHSGQELIDGLKHCLVASLRHYQAINKDYPQRIIFYRDGVGDGQLEAVLEHELPQIIDTFKSCGYEPKITFVIVKKRINTRFFARAGPGLQNPPPGTIVDDEVTRPEWYDFFLVSQSVRQGTVTPCHYNVVWDTSGLKPDHMQRLTYKLCHLYYNWPGTIRVPAPCQYAHKLAFLVGQSIHTAPSENLAQTLFFL
ncbi:piwi-like protein 1 [Branchiostoma lanceolatum]|uniref:piwi-like protein 1 n=1 Tax=Branchiostoma lanceolatum TaxID=7740 RepID=UPI003455F87E